MSSSGLLAHEETLVLIANAQKGDMAAREKLITSNIALIKSLVRRYASKGVEYEDLMQIGSIGLIKAVNGYDPKYGVRFSTYAVPLILGELKRYMRDDGMLKVSRSLKETYQKIKAAKEELEKRLNREPSINEIAAQIGCDTETVIMSIDCMRAPISLEQPMQNDNQDSPILDSIREPENSVDIVDRILLKESLAQLEPQERQIIVLRYFKDLTQSKIGEMMGLSQVQVSRIESRVLKKLNSKMKSI